MRTLEQPIAISSQGGTTPVPTALLDEVMPTLRDTELRVLLIVVRQTLGWQVGKDPARRKERDWLTQSQLMRRTGRASGAVARAVDVLVRRGLIDVLDAKGHPLPTPAERRRCLGRLYYRLHGAENAPAHEADGGETESAHAKPHTTTYTVYKKRQRSTAGVDNAVDKSPFVIRKGWVRASEAHGQQGQEVTPFLTPPAHDGT